MVACMLLSACKEQGQEISMTELMESKWKKDPYDENYSKGFLMNISENADFDEQFPQHPLSEARRFVSFVVSNN